MNEIELKARVKDKNALTEKLNSFATYEGFVIRDDRYFALPQEDGTFSRKKIRIRKESRNGKISYLVTWKRKEIQQDSHGASIEVNDERECIVSDDDCLVSFLEDSGYKIALNKHKEVHDWTYEGATFELCTVPPLGDFLEIEILTDSNKPEEIAAIKEKLHLLLQKAGLTNADLEARMYSQMLAEIKQ
ncbi:class IV adenylate cyclase [Treponema sp.]|uniref:class IV adenylate cyclase n=1 Tax=Treponema sp. TaxID=166 RepID=UPI0025DE4BE3|nr:class IV adenylate cyclase [Treponema sp.]MCR5217587.1 class IV adenylate cyclase [Treponema sp.]